MTSSPRVPEDTRPTEITHVDSFTDPGVTDFAVYGVRVACLGEDGDTWAAFTHDVRRAVAAVNAGHRWDTGDRARVTLDRAGWWRLRDNCGCGESCPHPDGECWEDEDGLCDPMLPPCGDVYGWRGEDVESGAEHAFPVIVFKVEGR